MRRGPTQKPDPLFQDEDIDIADLQDANIEDDDDDLSPREDDEGVPSDEDDLEGEEAVGPHR
jgi:hypothetical protein